MSTFLRELPDENDACPMCQGHGVELCRYHEEAIDAAIDVEAETVEPFEDDTTLAEECEAVTL